MASHRGRRVTADGQVKGWTWSSRRSFTALAASWSIILAGAHYRDTLPPSLRSVLDWTPLVVTVTGGSRNDVTQRLVEASQRPEVLGSGHYVGRTSLGHLKLSTT